MIKIIEGNILNAIEDIICQQVNCHGKMGSGLARQIRNKYPNVYESYVKLVNWQKEEYNKGLAKNKYLLGNIQFVDCPDGKVIANLFGQEGYGRDKRYTDYTALRSSLEGLYDTVTCDYNTLYCKSIAIPYNLGCGLAGGEWYIVYEMIKQIFYNYVVSIYKLNK